MSTKMKGLLKGLRYISHMFDEKEPEMQIGLPTDVKHVAHIGWDGGNSVDSPSWMNHFESPSGGGFQSAPLTLPSSKDNSEAKSEGSSRRSRDLESQKSTRRRSASDGNEPLRKERSRHSRRHHSKDSSEIGRSNLHLQLQDGSASSDLPSKPDIPKRTRRKKHRDSDGGGSSVRSKSRSTRSTHVSSYSDAGLDDESSVRSSVSETCQPSKIKSLGQEEEKDSCGLS